jgi:methylglutaconyl-CoA hydratase
MTTITIAKAAHVATITLARPDVRNAFDDTMIAELTASARELGADPAVRVVILRGAGPSFCAGADIAWMQRMVGYSEDENRRDARALAGMFETLDTLPKPLVGVIHGAALGGGTGLAAVCDIVIAADDALFGFTEVKLGILPAVISPYSVAKIGVSHTRALFLTGERFTAQRAREIGLVHHVVPAAVLDQQLGAIVQELSSSAPGAMAAAKALIPRVAAMAPADAMALTSATIAAQRVSPEGQDGLTAFLGKRKPGWTA